MIRGTAGTPRGGALDGARVYVSDQAHFSIARALDVLGFPGRDAPRVALRRPVPPAGRAGRRGDRGGPGGGAHPARDRGRRRFDEHRLGRRRPRARRPRPARERLAACRRGLRRRRAPARPATPIAYPVWSAPTASRSIRTSGSSRPTTSARWSCAGARISSARSTESPEYYRVGEAGGRAAQLVPVLDRGHAPVPGAEALDELEAAGHRRPRRARRAQRRPGRVPRRAGARPIPTSRPRPPSPSSRSCASATSRPDPTAGRPRRSTATRRPCSARSRSAGRPG